MEDILLKYTNDPHEYVNRRALISLGKIKSRYAENKALIVWQNDNVYQKIAALHVLHEIGSVNLKLLLMEAKNHESSIVREYVNKLI